MEETISVSSATTPEAEQAVNQQYNKEVNQVSDISISDNGVDRITVSSQESEVEAAPAADPYVMPDKFANAEDPQAALLKAYINLEKSKGEPQPDVNATEVQEQESGAFDITEYHELWANQGGKLEDSQWSKLQETTGLPLDVLKQYETMYNEKAQAGVITNDDKIYNLSGGKEKYDQMLEWANDNMNSDQITALNMQLDNPAFSEMGVKMLASMYDQGNGHEARTTTIDKANTPLVDESDDFHNDADFQRAMKHPEYGKEGAYDQWFDRKAIKLMNKQKRK